MILSKIKKHFFLFLVRLKQKKTIKSLLAQDNNLLNLIVESFLKLKKNNLSDSEIKIFKSCEYYRTQLLNDHRSISFEVFGSNKTMLVKDICNKAASKPIWAQFLYLITKNFSNPQFLEIGTNLGVSGTYILEALKDKKNSKFFTMEGIPQLCEIADNQFSRICSNSKYKIYKGLYKNTFSELIKDNNNFDIIFIDGNHKKDPTVQYFSELQNKLSSKAIIIFDDINWNSEMQEAWHIVKSYKNVTYSIDMFKFGLLIVDNTKVSKKSDYYLHLAY